MEDISTFVWVGIGVLWLLSKLVGRGVKKVTEAQRSRPPAGGSPPGARTEIPQPLVDGRPVASGRGGTSPPPIVPR